MDCMAPLIDHRSSAFRQPLVSMRHNTPAKQYVPLGLYDLLVATTRPDNPLSKAALRSWLESHPDTKPGSVDASSDYRHSISSNVIRAIWQGNHVAAVGSGIASRYAIGAVLDLL